MQRVKIFDKNLLILYNNLKAMKKTGVKDRGQRDLPLAERRLHKGFYDIHFGAAFPN